MARRELIHGHLACPCVAVEAAAELVDHVDAEVGDVNLLLAVVGDLDESLTIRAGVGHLGDEHVPALRRGRRLGRVRLVRRAGRG